MKKITFLLLILITGITAATAQQTKDRSEQIETAKAAREQMREEKAQFTNAAATTPQPSDFADPDSFGKNAKFLGSMYAGTLYIYKSCDPAVLQTDLGIILAADDKCAVNSPTTPMPWADVTDPAWQITIPGRTVDNVIYPMLNHGAGWDLFHDTISGDASLVYSPYVVIESSALNDATAINPTTGLPMAGSYRALLPGFINRFQPYTAGTSIGDWDSRAAVGGRGFSRTYFAALGLPQSVINNLFRQPMTLKFGIRARAFGPVYDAQFYYSVRLIGN